jgi:hypothetical protein
MKASPEQKALVLEAARRTPSPSRETTSLYARRIVQATMVVTLVVFVAVGGMHLHRRPDDLIMKSVAAWGAVTLATTWLAASRGGSMLGRPPAWLVTGAVLTAPLLAALWFVCTLPLGEPSVSHGFKIDAACFAISLALGLAPLVAFFAMRREGDPLHPAATGAAFGAAAGAWGALLINLHCEMTDGRHVMLGHALPTVVLVALGAIVGRRALAVRAMP